MVLYPLKPGMNPLITLPPMLFSGDLLYWAIIFFVLAIIAGVVGFQGVAGISMDIAKILVVVFLVLAIVALVL